MYLYITWEDVILFIYFFPTLLYILIDFHDLALINVRKERERETERLVWRVVW